ELGQGAEFKLLLPIQAYPENHQTKVEVQNLLLQEQVYTHFDKPAKILIVDDNKSVANFLCELFVGAGYNATASTNSLDAFEHFSKNPEMFDLIITDQTMPNLSGFELARLILKIKPNLPIVLCTGYSEHIDKETALALGIRSYHNKPINPSLLFNTVNELLNSAA
ncbi:MAG: response regulator, partial [Nitrosopumilus sp.]|nr:response regulator [Nitrosopumilus sp.]